jgi:CRISPR/Cas system-associated endonuclease Cas1
VGLQDVPLDHNCSLAARNVQSVDDVVIKVLPSEQISHKHVSSFPQVCGIQSHRKSKEHQSALRMTVALQVDQAFLTAGFNF